MHAPDDGLEAAAVAAALAGKGAPAHLRPHGCHYGICRRLGRLQERHLVEVVPHTGQHERCWQQQTQREASQREVVHARHAGTSGAQSLTRHTAALNCTATASADRIKGPSQQQGQTCTQKQASYHHSTEGMNACYADCRRALHCSTGAHGSFGDDRNAQYMMTPLITLMTRLITIMTRLITMMTRLITLMPRSLFD